jgi:hypothetical protein
MVAVTAALALAIVLTRLVYEASSNAQLLILSHGLSFALMAVVAVTIVMQVFQAREITADIIVGRCAFISSSAPPGRFILFPSSRGSRVNDGDTNRNSRQPCSRAA